MIFHVFFLGYGWFKRTMIAGEILQTLVAENQFSSGWLFSYRRVQVWPEIPAIRCYKSVSHPIKMEWESRKNKHIEISGL